ncbi:MAG: response regulator transcription factor [Reyranella sp.]|nr:response regulator transcription factor [Reyranella sp.]
MSEGTIDSLSSSILASPDEAAAKSGRVRMLVVEGDPSTLANLATVLAKRGFDVESFHDHPALNERPHKAVGHTVGLDGVPVAGGTLPQAPAFRRPSSPPTERFTCGKLQIDLAQRRIWWNDVEVHLTGGEFRIVVLLASHADCCVDYRTIYDYLHYKGFQSGYGEKGFWVNVRSVIRRIRGRFRAADSSFDSIESIRAFGYRWRRQS